MDNQLNTQEPAPIIETPPTQNKRKSPLVLIIIGAVLLVGIIVGAIYINWYNNGPCGVKAVEEGVKLLDDQYDVFKDALAIAGSTSRISLSGPIADLQEIGRDTEDIEVTECLIPARSWLVYSIDKYTTAFLKFTSNEDDDVVSAWITGASSALDSYLEEISRVQECTPNCEPGTMPAGVPGY